MPIFKVEIDCRNDATQKRSEVVRLLREAADAYEIGASLIRLTDVNGNYVGESSIVYDKEDYQGAYSKGWRDKGVTS